MTIPYTLSVTSPYTIGPQVREIQQVLAGGNVEGVDYLHGPVDGIFGEGTGRGCIRAKFWKGYPSAALHPTYGQVLDEYLHGLRQPTPEMLKRVVLRELHAGQTPLREKALIKARRQLGVKEQPAGSNKVLYSDWYGLRGPWCAMFVSWCYVKVGSKAFVKGSRYAYVPYVVQDARAGRNGLSVTHSPKPGDIVCYDWDGGVADHTGLFKAWLPGAEGSEFYAIEGNTAVGNDSNGGEVMERHRVIRQVECFVRVGK